MGVYVAFICALPAVSAMIKLIGGETTVWCGVVVAGGSQFFLTILKRFFRLEQSRPQRKDDLPGGKTDHIPP